MTVSIASERCIGCGICVMECPAEALDLVDGIAAVDEKKCTDSGNCIEVCPSNALSSGEDFKDSKPLHNNSPEKSSGTAEEEKNLDPDTAGWSGVWVVLEYHNNQVAQVSWELMGEGRKLADEIGCELAGVICGCRVDNVIEEAFAYGAEKVFVIDDPVLKNYRTQPYAEGIVKLVQKYRPEILLMGATSIGRDVFPAVATKIGTGLTADCTVLEIDPVSKLLRQTRPAFGGNIMATILCKKHRPQMATVRSGVMKLPQRVEGKAGLVIREKLSINEEDIPIKVLDFIKAIDSKSIFLDKAEVIVAVGLGIGAKKNTTLAEELADLLGGTIAGTRGVVEAGWLGHEYQVGQTGTTVRPNLYIAIGISGALQHLVGMERSDYIIAVNNDPEAPIFSVADLGIIGDLNKVVPAMISEIKKYSEYEIAN